MPLAVEHLTVDCHDPPRLARFWAEATAGEVLSAREGFALVRITGTVVVAFARVPERKAGKNRLHLDLTADDRPGEVARLCALGGCVLGERSGAGFAWTVMADPEGNEFCVA